MVAELPLTSKISASLCLKLAPKLVSVIGSPTASQELLIDCLDISADVFTRYAPSIQSKPALQTSALEAFLRALQHSNAGVRKRAMSAIGALGLCASSEVFTQICTPIIEQLLDGSPAAKDSMILLTGVLARTSPRRIGRRLPEILPRLLPFTLVEDRDETREVALQTIETLLLRCPAEVTPFVGQSIDAATQSLSHDPNYAGGADDEDEEMEEDEEEEEDEDDEFEMEDYDDDDDLSWKVRRASAKVLNAAIVTRPELLTTFTEKIAPLLVSRASDREETVRVEVLNTLVTLLRQTQLYSGTAQATEVMLPSSPTVLMKRKFTSIEEGGGGPGGAAGTPRGMIAQSVPNLMKTIHKELGGSKSTATATRVICLVMLRELMLLLHGGLESYLGTLLVQVEKALKTSESSASNSANIRVESLALLRLLFLTHSPQHYEEHLGRVMPILTSNIEDKLHRNSLEAFSTASQLLISLRPSFPSSSSSAANGRRSSPARVSDSPPITNAIYDAVVSRLNRADSDQAIRERGLKTLAILLAHAGDDVQRKHPECFKMLLERLRNEVTQVPTLQLISRVAPSPVCASDAFDAFLLQAASDASAMLVKGNRQFKAAVLDSLGAILSRAGAQMQPAVIGEIVSSLLPLFGAEADINLLPNALKTVEAVIKQQPGTIGLVQKDVLPRVYETLSSPLASGTALAALLSFFQTVAGASTELSSLILADLFKHAAQNKASDGGSATQTHTVIARCIGALARTAGPSIVTNALAEAQKGLSSGSEADAFFSLRIIGDIGRLQDLSGQKKLLDAVLGFYSSKSEEIRTAAAYAVGGLAVGNMAAFLPVIESHITSDPAKRYLSLHALKEVIANADTQSLVPVAERVWTPLFDICESKDEAARNMAAECLGRLTIAAPERYLIQLQERLRSEAAATRVAVLVAVRFTLTESATTYDELLSPIIIEFLSLLKDSDLEVRRHAVLAFNSAAYNKPALLRDWLAQLLPLLYRETVPRPELLRKVPMGPFTITQDDGLELRKSAFEAMITLLDSCFSKINTEDCECIG